MRMSRHARTAARLVLATLIGIAGCAGAVEHGVWTRPDTDVRQIGRDEYACDREARLTYGSQAFDRSAGAPGLEAYERCMNARGYRRQPTSRDTDSAR